MKLVARKNNKGTFDWVEDGKVVATISLYQDGLVEFKNVVNKQSVSIELVGTDEEQVYVDVLDDYQLLVEPSDHGPVQAIVGPGAGARIKTRTKKKK